MNNRYKPTKVAGFVLKVNLLRRRINIPETRLKTKNTAVKSTGIQAKRGSALYLPAKRNRQKITSKENMKDMALANQPKMLGRNLYAG